MAPLAQRPSDSSIRLKKCPDIQQNDRQLYAFRHARLIAVKSPGIKSNSTGSDETAEVVPLWIEQDLNGVGTGRDIERENCDTRVWLIGFLSSLELRGVGRADGVEFLENDARRRVQDLHLKRLASKLEGRVGTIDSDCCIGVHTPRNGGLNVIDLVLKQDLTSTVDEADTSLDVPGKAVSSKQRIPVNVRTLRMQR